jgi:hypothetical protein
MLNMVPLHTDLQKKNILNKLDSTPHHQGLRIALGAFRSTRVENLLCEAGSSTLEHRRLLITAKAAIRSMATNEHPIKKNWVTKPFHIRAMDAAATLDIDYQKIRQFFPSLHPP